MISLTALSFYLVLFHLISPPFLIILLVTFALIQIFIQLDRFMDIREEGKYRLTSLIGGSFVALLAIIFLILL